MSPVAEVLKDAADLIERDGWCQGAYLGPARQRCMSTAIHDAARGDLDLSEEAHKPVRQEIKFGFVSHWNDHPSRTKDEVIVALRAAAERAS